MYKLLFPLFVTLDIRSLFAWVILTKDSAQRGKSVRVGGGLCCVDGLETGNRSTSRLPSLGAESPSLTHVLSAIHSSSATCALAGAAGGLGRNRQAFISRAALGSGLLLCVC